MDETVEPMEEPDEQAADGAEGRTRARDVPLTQRVGQVALIVIGALFVVFAVANAQFVDFSWIFGRTEVVQTGGDRIGGGVPLIVLLLAAFLAGLVIGAGTVWRRERRRRRDSDRP